MKSTESSKAQVFDEILLKGTSSTSFLTLYSGYQYFRSENPRTVIPYVHTATAWVGASEPIGPLPEQVQALEAFFKSAHDHFVPAVALPVSRSLAVEARKKGRFAVQIGSEPWISLEKFDDEDFLNEIHVAKRLKAKGAIVENIDSMAITERVRAELDSLVDAWLDSRPSVPLSFLNRVEPWHHVKYKRYFRLVFQGKTVVFLAAVPVTSRKAWYFVDLLRTPDAPPGATELIVIEAMKSVKNEGAHEVTLGMSPLVPVQRDERSVHPLLYWVFDRIFYGPKTFYSFESLYEYKTKFTPTRWEPLYLVSSSWMGPRVFYGLFRAVFPAGLVRTAFEFLDKKKRSLRIDSIYRTLLSNQIVPRSAPKLMELPIRVRSTLVLLLINFLFFHITVDASGKQIQKAVEGQYGFTLQSILSHGLSWSNFKMLTFSSLMHWTPFHLWSNLFLLAAFGGILEIVAGTTVLSLAYVAGVLLANPVTSLMGYWVFRLIHPEWASQVLSHIDIGCSLGVFACIGATTHFLKRTAWSIAVLSVLIVIYSVYTQNLLDLSHLTSLFLGLSIGKIYAPKKFNTN